MFDLDETFIEALSLANIKCIAAVILRGMASILSNVHDILHEQHFFEFYKCNLGFSKGKMHFFPKVLENWSSCQIKENNFFLGGGRTKSNN